MTVTDNVPAYLFVDIETTGLDPQRDHILEVGVAAVNELFQVIDEKSWLIVERGWRAKLASNEFVWDMHTKSGLIAELEAAEGLIGRLAVTRYSLTEVSWNVCKWIEAWFGDKKIPMAGSSVHFDRSFLVEDLTNVAFKFSHRNIDVSSIKELVKMWYPEIAAEREKEWAQLGKDHRVLADIHASVDELKYYRNMVFIP